MIAVTFPKHLSLSHNSWRWYVKAHSCPKIGTEVEHG
jgi:hypothetical protein